MGCVSVINLSAVLGGFVSPFTHTNFYKKLIIVMIGLAVGSLSASSLFHLIPQVSIQVITIKHSLMAR